MGSISFAFNGQLSQSREEARFIAQCRSMVMVGMPRRPVGEDDGFRTQLTNAGREPQFVLAARLDVGIWDAESAAPLYREQSCRARCLFRASLRRAARSHFTRGQIEDASLVSALRHLEQRAAACELHVIGVCGNGQ